MGPQPDTTNLDAGPLRVGYMLALIHLQAASRLQPICSNLSTFSNFFVSTKVRLSGCFQVLFMTSHADPFFATRVAQASRASPMAIAVHSLLTTCSRS